MALLCKLGDRLALVGLHPVVAYLDKVMPGLVEILDDGLADALESVDGLGEVLDLLDL